MTFAELFTRFGSIIGSLVFIWAIFQQYFPFELRACFEKYSHRFLSFLYPYVQITFNEFTGEGFTRSEVYIAIQNYLTRNSSSQAKRLKADSIKNNQSLVLTMDDHEEIAEQFNGVKLWWSSGKNISKSQTISFHPASEEKRYFMLTFHKRHRDLIIEQYLNHVLKEGKAIKVKNRQRKLFTNQDAQWSHVVFEHPATFQTLAMKPEKKKEIMEDLIAFSQAEEFYKEIGRAWKRGYLLHGPPGTGKSTMIAAMANLLGYDIYDPSEVTLSGLLNFIDGLWSACGGERLVVFTTNYIEKLKIESHPLFFKIEKLIGEVRITPADVAEHLMPKAVSGYPGDCLKSLIEALEWLREDEERVKAEQNQRRKEEPVAVEEEDEL